MSAFDILAICIFIFCNIAVAIRVRGGQKNFGEYAIGKDKSFSDWTIILTIVATFASGSFLINGVQQTYLRGIQYIMRFIVMQTVSYVIMALWVVPKLTMQTFTIYEFLGYFYGNKIRSVFALSEILYRIGYISVQLNIIGIGANMIFGCEGLIRVIIICVSAFILCIYTAFGGLKAVSVTDICQSLFFILVIIFIAFYMWSCDNEHTGFISQFNKNSPRMSINSCFISWPMTISTLALWLGTLIPWRSTPFYQRVLMAHSPWRAKQLMLMATLIYITLSAIVVFIGLQTYGSNPNLKLADIWPYIIKTFSFPGINGLIFIAILSLVVSTVDSHLNSTSTVITNDLLPFVSNKFKQRTYKTAMLTTFIVMAISLFIALQSSDIFKTLLYSNNFNIPIIIIILATVMGLRTHQNVIWTAIISAFVATVSYSFFMRSTGFAQYAFFPGMCACGASLILGHLYYTKIKGWKNDKEEPYYDPYTPEQNAAMLRRAATGEWMDKFDKDIKKKEFEKKYKEIMIEKMKRTVEEYEEEKQKKEEEVNKTIENVRNNILDSKKKEEERTYGIIVEYVKTIQKRK